MASKAVLVFAVLALIAAISEAAIHPFTPPTKGPNCMCMNSKYCDGRINSDVECRPGYVMVCCIRPEPETAPPYSPETIKAEDIQVVQV